MTSVDLTYFVTVTYVLQFHYYSKKHLVCTFNIQKCHLAHIAMYIALIL